MMFDCSVRGGLPDPAVGNIHTPLGIINSLQGNHLGLGEYPVV